MIPEEVFLNKKLSDSLRDIVINSLCSFEEALRLLHISKNHDRDVELIIKMKNCGLKEHKVRMFISCINS